MDTMFCGIILSHAIKSYILLPFIIFDINVCAVVFFGVDSLYGNWFDHVTSYWMGLKNHSNILFVFYEELIKVCGI